MSTSDTHAGFVYGVTKYTAKHKLAVLKTMFSWHLNFEKLLLVYVLIHGAQGAPLLGSP